MQRQTEANKVHHSEGAASNVTTTIFGFPTKSYFFFFIHRKMYIIILIYQSIPKKEESTACAHPFEFCNYNCRQLFVVVHCSCVEKRCINTLRCVCLHTQSFVYFLVEKKRFMYSWIMTFVWALRLHLIDISRFFGSKKVVFMRFSVLTQRYSTRFCALLIAWSCVNVFLTAKPRWCECKIS